MENEKKANEYAAKIAAQIMGMFNENCVLYINPDDFDEEGTANAFMHAMATLAPSVVYKKLTREEIDSIAKKIK